MHCHLKSLAGLLCLPLVLPGFVAHGEEAGSEQESAGLSPQIVEEVLIIAPGGGAETEIEAETERLFGVAGAALDPLQAIYSLPGVTFSAGFASEPVIRGSAPQDNAYYIDLVPANYIFHVFGNSIFDKNIIHSFNLYPAAFPSEYGNATGGVIDVSLRQPRNQDFTTTLSASFLIAGVMVESGIGEHQAIYASYRRSTMDLIFREDDFTDEEEGFQVDQLPIADDYQVKYNWNINPNSRLTFVAAGANDELGATFSEGSNPVERDPDFAGAATIRLGFDSQGLIWDWWQDKRRVSTLLTHIQDQQKFDFGVDQREHSVSDRFLLRFRYGQALGDANYLTTGLSVEHTSYDIDFNAKFVACTDFDPDCSTVDAQFVTYQDQLAFLSTEFFLEDAIRLNEKHTLTLGFHFTGNDYLNERRIEPRGTWRYNFADNWSTYVSAGKYSQLPELREMIDVLGNPNLTTVKADHYVWGLSQDLGRGWSWKTDLYYKDLSDIVISDATSIYSNGATGSAYGLEFLVNKNITDRWYGWTSVSFSKTRRTDTLTGENVDFQYDKPVLYNLVLNRLIGSRWMIGFKWNYQSGGRYTPITGLTPSSSEPEVLEPVYGTLNSEQLPDYHRLDFRTEYLDQRSWGYFKFFIDLINVYNRHNVTGYDYAPNGNNLVSPPPGFGEDVPVTARTTIGLLPSIGVEVQF